MGLERKLLLGGRLNLERNEEKKNIYHTLKCAFLCFKSNSVTARHLDCVVPSVLGGISYHVIFSLKKKYNLWINGEKFPMRPEEAWEQPNPPTNQKTNITLHHCHVMTSSCFLSTGVPVVWAPNSLARILMLAKRAGRLNPTLRDKKIIALGPVSVSLRRVSTWIFCLWRVPWYNLTLPARIAPKLDRVSLLWLHSPLHKNLDTV